MNAARDILQSLRGYAWPLVAYMIGAPLPTYLFPSRYSRQERTMRLFWVGVMISSIGALFFVLAESGNIVQVARLHPAWGAYVLLLALVPLGAGARWVVARSRENRTAISISQITEAESSSGKKHTAAYIAGAGAWVACSVMALVWLSKIANSQ